VLDGNSATKYLNFDKLNTGFTVTPAGASTIQGIALTSANDEPNRDPASFKIEGSVNGTTFTTVAEGTQRHSPLGSRAVNTTSPTTWLIPAIG
jgi:hypothetical protein